MQQDSVKLGRALNAYMREHRYTQTYIADKAQVDQATVSRFLKKPPQRVTVANQKLCSYAESLLSQVADEGDKAVAQKAFDECWNQSGIHAQAVSRILNALAELCRHDRQKGVTPG